MQRYLFQLFVSDAEGKDRAAINNLHRLCESQFERSYEIAIIDVNRRPELAEQGRILATPALVKAAPLPRKCVVGDLVDSEEVLRALALWEDSHHSSTAHDAAGCNCKPR